jgi:metal-responsive CopG/Arc/MetJ family transcriptional regulator
MAKEKISITLEAKSIDELDRLIGEDIFKNRSQAIQEAVSEKLMHLKKTRLTEECAKLNPTSEKELAEEGLAGDVTEWPEY